MAGIRKLPNEVLGLVFQDLLVMENVDSMFAALHTPTASSAADLRAVSLTSRRFHDIVAPVLWENVNIGTREVARGPSVQQIVRLLRLWHSRPDIAGHVRNVSVAWSSLKRERWLLSNYDIVFLSDLARKLGLDTNRVSSLCSTPQTPDLVAGLAILMAPNVTLVDLFPNTQYIDYERVSSAGDPVDVPPNSSAFFRTIPEPEHTTVRLQRLHHLRIRGPRDHSFEFTEVAPLLKLAPKVKIFDAYPAAYEEIIPIDFKDWSGFTSILSKNHDLDTEVILGLITGKHELQEFVLQGATYRLDPDLVLGALTRHHARTLRKLSIRLVRCLPSPVGIKCFATFTRLEEFTLISDDIGTGEDCVLRMLPASLVRLVLDFRYPGTKREELEQFAKSIQAGVYSNLREVEMYGCDGLHDGPCRGRFVSEDLGHETCIADPGSHTEELEVGCGDEIVMKLKAVLVDAGAKCKICWKK